MSFKFTDLILLGDITMKVVGSHTHLNDISSPVVLTKPEGARRIKIQAKQADIRYRMDGVNPTGDIGFIIQPTDIPVVLPVPGDDIRLIEASPSAKLDYQWLT